ncbi:MAG TPA: hypothetical protein VGR26_14830 [Acidimicrobiales bacterium]|nr:hypothetical protein [Acidimicrobiales bacterium]
MTAQLPDYILERRAAQDAADRTAPDLDLVEIGCRLTIGHAPRNDEEALLVEEQEFDDIGVGTVYAIVSDPDPETGEIRRAFLTVRFAGGRVHWRRVTEDQVANVRLPDVSSLRYLIRTLGRELGKRKRGLTSEDRKLIEALYALGTSQASRWA